MRSGSPPWTPPPRSGSPASTPPCGGTSASAPVIDGTSATTPAEAVRAAAEALATRHDLQSMLVQIRKARRDLSVPPHFEGPGVPYAFVLGAEEVGAMPGDRARRTPLRESPIPLGPRTRPALYYPLPADPGDLSGWQDFERLMRHLKGDPTR
ncbi:DUF6177 family protein [Streptomyces sp. NPDC093984]|uniref:DUF6177 family protein n=1 Tax=Streptomyces sp. NPDC093984 TaxID=3366052 RepID=UPI0037FD915F